MAQIVLNVTGNNAMQLGAEEFVRPMSIGNNWQKIRIAVRMMINGSAAITTPRLLIGLCSGAVDTYSSANCVGWAGSCWPYQANTPFYHANNYYYWSNGGAASFGACTKIGAVLTEISASDNSTHAIAGVLTGKASIVSTDIIRTVAGGTSYSVKPNLCSGAQAVTNPDRYSFLRCIEDETYLSAFAATYQSAQGTAGGYSVTGLPQVLDTVSIVWTKSTPTIEICDITVLRFY